MARNPFEAIEEEIVELLPGLEVQRYAVREQVKGKNLRRVAGTQGAPATVTISVT